MANVDRACIEVKETVSHRGAAEHLFACQLLFREAANNAISHGNREEPARIIKTLLNIHDKQISLTIVDEGDGFDWRAVLNRPQDLEATSGRGFMIMRDYATKILFNRKGNKLTLIISRK